MPCALITWALISPATCGRGCMWYIKTPPKYRPLATKYEILNCLKGFAGFWRFIMKSLTYVLKITAIALNTYFSAWLLLFVCTGYGGHPLSLYAWLSSILICAVPPVTLITIALTFHKNLKILNSYSLPFPPYSILLTTYYFFLALCFIIHW